MKIVIDIPDKVWDIAKEYGHLDICGIELSERVMNGTPYEERPKTDILEQIIAEINSSNRGTCDYYIVDRIEEIINEYQKCHESNG